MATVFCKACGKPVLEGWMGVDGNGYHREHPEPVGPRDPAIQGRCSDGGHPAKAIFLAPRDGKHYCIDHLRTLLTEAIRRGQFGEKG